MGDGGARLVTEGLDMLGERLARLVVEDEELEQSTAPAKRASGTVRGPRGKKATA